MFLAIIGDIMSNFSGLQRILRDLEEAGIHHIVHTGNSCYGPQGAQSCVDLLREKQVVSVQGRMDRALSLRKFKPHEKWDSQVLQATYAALDSASIEYLGRLPRKYRFSMEGMQWVLCHGALTSPSEVLSKETGYAKLLRQRELEIADIIITGGAEDPFSLEVAGTLFVGPGVLATKEGMIRYTLVNTEALPYRASVVML